MAIQATENYIYGQADVTFKGQKIQDIFEELEVTIEPIFEDIKHAYEYGESIVDRAIKGYNVSVSTSFAKEHEDYVKMAIIGEATEDTFALQDAAIGQLLSKMEVGGELIIVPRHGEEEAKAKKTITILNAVPNGSFKRVYKNGQGSFEMGWVGMVKKDTDPTKGGNYFRFGKPASQQ